MRYAISKTKQPPMKRRNSSTLWTIPCKSCRRARSPNKKKIAEMSFEKAKSMETGLEIVLDGATGEKSKHQKPFLVRAKYIWSHMTVEPVLLFYILPSMMITIAVQNLNLEKACRVNLAIATDRCDALTIRNESAYPDYKYDEERVQTLASYMAMLKNTVVSVIPGIILLFLGSWSDRFQKRKSCMLVPVLGDIVSISGLMICTYFFDELPMEVNSLCEAVFPAISGTWFAMFAGVYSYISDVSNEEERTVRIGAVNMLTNVSMCVGTALSGVLYQAIGFYGVYLTALVMDLISLTYGYFYIHDPVVREVESKGFCQDFFQTDHVKETFKTAIRSGQKRGRRRRVCAILFLFLVVFGPLYGEMNVVYFFARYRFGWDSIEFSFFSTFQFITSTVGTIVSLSVFSQYLKIDDALLGIISCFSKILACCVYAFAPTSLYFFLGAVVESLNGTGFIAMRAMITKLVLPDELGKINSLFGILEAVQPVIYGPLYSKIYASTIDFFPGCFYVVGALLILPAPFLFYWLYLEHKRDLNEAKVTVPNEEKLLPGKEQIQ